MAYDESLAEQVRNLLDTEKNITEKKMFGGLAFLLNGNMAVVVSGKGGLMVRTDPEKHTETPAESGVEPTVMRGKEMRGWFDLPPSIGEDAGTLRKWVDRTLAFTATLPPK